MNIHNGTTCLHATLHAHFDALKAAFRLGKGHSAVTPHSVAVVHWCEGLQCIDATTCRMSLYKMQCAAGSYFIHVALRAMWSVDISSCMCTDNKLYKRYKSVHAAFAFEGWCICLFGTLMQGGAIKPWKFALREDWNRSISGTACAPRKRHPAKNKITLVNK